MPLTRSLTKLHSWRTLLTNRLQPRHQPKEPVRDESRGWVESHRLFRRASVEELRFGRR